MIDKPKKDQLRRYITLTPYGKDHYMVEEYYQTKRDVKINHSIRDLPTVIRGYSGQYRIGEIIKTESIKHLIVTI